jgi:hypothetical protein
VKQGQEEDITTPDIKEAMIPYLAESKDYTGQKIGNLLDRFGLNTERSRLEKRYIYTIDGDKVIALLKNYKISS